MDFDLQAFILLAIATVAGILLVVWGRRLQLRIERYRFENIDSGGIVRHASFEAMKKQGRQKQAAGCALALGIVLMLFAGLPFVAAIAIKVLKLS